MALLHTLRNISCCMKNTIQHRLLLSCGLSSEVGLGDYLVLDGGMGTEVTSRMDETRRRQVNLDPIWSSRFLQKNEDIFTQVHKDFLDAGADVIMTNSYKPSLENLMDNMNISREQALQLFRKASAVAKQVRDEFWQQHKDSGRRYPLVAAALGPYGSRTFTAAEYDGKYVETTSIQEMVEGHLYKSEALQQGGADLLGFETVPAAKEGEALAELMKLLPGSKAWVVFSCKDGQHTCHGETIGEAVSTSLLSEQIIGVGINCTAPQYITSLLQNIPSEVKHSKKIIVYPNNGQVWDKQNKFWHGPEDKRQLPEYVAEWLDAGANWIGGCCNVSPKDISNIKTEMDKYLRIRKNISN